MIEALEPDNQWDQTFICDLLAQVDHSGVHVLIIPGRYWFDKIDEINNRLQDKPNVLVVITGDEEALFDTSQLEHPNMRICVQSPHLHDRRKADMWLPIGYTPGIRDPKSRPGKSLRWFFAGQNTHKRRNECVEVLRQIEGGALFPTKSFNEGLEHDDYLDIMFSAVAVPCPSGAVIPDTFRLYEALEAGCVPLADGFDPKMGSQGYWRYLFDTNDIPFPIIEDWGDAPGTINYVNDIFPTFNNRVFGWWQQQKRLLRLRLQKEIAMLGVPYHEDTTVLVATSPISGHPTTKMLEETIKSIRFHLPEVEILVMFDGVRPEQEHYRTRYEKYKENALWWINQQLNITPILFEEHQHQARMTRATLKQVTTPTIMFVEHDTPLVTDCDIEFDKIQKLISDNKADVVRLHHEARIHPDHEHLMVDSEPQNGFLRTAQWSQRPHVANTDYYRMLLANIHEDSKTMIEDAIHGLTQTKWLEQGYPGWNEHRIWIYAPEANLKRSYHLDGRGNDPKYEMT